MRLLYLFLLFFIASSIKIYAQEGYISPPTSCSGCRISSTDGTAPYASYSQYDVLKQVPSSIGRYGETYVDTYTGVPSINIPLYTIKHKELTIPISIAYDASGVKVASEASWVGLNWDMIAGNSITRVVRDGDDFVFNLNGYNNTKQYKDGFIPYSGYNYNCNNCLLNNPDYKYQVGAGIKNEKDLQSDIFHFQAGGKSGKFVLDMERGSIRKAHELIASSNKIELIYTNNLQIPSFKITTSDGIQYFYGEEPVQTYSSMQDLPLNPKYTESITINTYSQLEGGAQEEDTRVIVDKWHLRKIITTSGDVIIFTYDNDFTKVNYSPYSISHIYQSFEHLESATPDAKTLVNQSVTRNGRNISKIEFPNGEIRFIVNSTTRVDQPYGAQEPKIEAVEVYDIFSSPAKLVKKWHFTQSYFNLVMGSSQRSFLMTRMKLLKLQEVNVNNGDYSPPYLFEYDETNNITFQGVNLSFPDKMSSMIDHWGYFNNRPYFDVNDPAYNNNPYLNPPREVLHDDNGYIFYSGNDRRVNATVNQALILKKITYPTKGYTEYIYESNTYLGLDRPNFGNVDVPTVKLAGGLRIKEIKTYDNISGQYSYKKYDYSLLDDNGNITSLSSGVLMEDRMYTRIPSSPRTTLYGVEYNPGWPVVRSANNILPVGVHNNGNVVGYANVTVSEGQSGELGKYVYKYHAMPNYYYDAVVNLGVESTNTSSLYSKYYIFVYKDIQKYVDNPITSAPYTNAYIYNGRLKEEYMYKKKVGGYVLSSKKQYTYGQSDINTLYPKSTGFSQLNIIKNGFSYSEVVLCLRQISDGSYDGDYQQRDNCNNYELIKYYTGSYYMQLGNIDYYMYDESNPSNYIVKSTGYFNFNQQQYPEQIQFELNSINKKLHSARFIFYPTDFKDTEVMKEFVRRNIFNQPIEIIDALGNDITKLKIKSSIVSTYKLDNINSPIVLDKQYKLDTDQLLEGTTDVTQSNLSGNFILSNIKSKYSGIQLFDNDYSLKQTFSVYDSKFNIAETVITGGVSQATIWGYNKTLPIASVNNATVSQIAYTGFEDKPSDYGWEIGSGLYNRQINADNVYSGEYSYKIPAGQSSFGPTKNITPVSQSGKYRFSAWVKTNSISTNARLVIYTVKEGNCCTIFPNVSSATVYSQILDTKGNWKYFEVILDLDKVRIDGGIAINENLTLRCFVVNDNPNNVVYVDDLRIYPVGALMKTSTYSPLVGITSQTDENNNTTHTDYDGLQRVLYIRDRDKNIIKRYTYNFQQ